MDMAVDDARHDELAAHVGYLSLIFCEAGLISHINKLAILHHQRSGLRGTLVRSENLSILDNHIGHIEVGLCGIIDYVDTRCEQTSTANEDGGHHP